MAPKDSPPWLELVESCNYELPLSNTIYRDVWEEIHHVSMVLFRFNARKNAVLLLQSIGHGYIWGLSTLQSHHQAP
jgi:hypothetical protein